MKQSESRLGGREAEKVTATTNMNTSNKLKLLKFASIWCCFMQILASASDPPSIITDNLKKPITFEQGWEILQGAFDRVINTVQGVDNQSLTSEEYMEYYTTVYNMCTQKPSHDYSQQLYDKYRESYEEYITSMVLPSLREKHDEFMLRELVKRWENYKIMVRWLTRFFHYLDRYFIPQRSLPSLNEVGLTCFRNVVYRELNAKVRDAVISLIDREREGEQIDRALLKNVLDIFVESGMDHYENDFEAAILRDTAAYYSRKASNWILKYSCPDYMLKAEECIRQEKHRFSHYFHSGSEPKLLEKVLHELFSVYAMELLDKEHSGCHALFRDDDKVVEHELLSVNASELQEKETT